MQGSTEFEHINIDKSEPVVLVTGVGGQLGYDVANQLLSRGYKVIGTDIKDHRGNIGVTTTQQMIEQERNISEFNIYDYIVRSFKRRFCIMLY